MPLYQSASLTRANHANKAPGHRPELVPGDVNGPLRRRADGDSRPVLPLISGSSGYPYRRHPSTLKPSMMQRRLDSCCPH